MAKVIQAPVAQLIDWCAMHAAQYSDIDTARTSFEIDFPRRSGAQILHAANRLGTNLF